MGWLNPANTNIERWAYVFQRVTGLGILAYVVGHIGDTSFFVGGPFGSGPSAASWSFDLALVENVVGHVVLGLVVLIVVYHGANGMRLILAEYGIIFQRPSRPEYPYRPKSLMSMQRHLIWVAIVAAVVAALYSGAVMSG